MDDVATTSKHRALNTGFIELPGDNEGFKCEACDQLFKLKGSWRRHYMQEHIQTPTPVTCHLCAKTYRNDRCLQEHYRRGHGIYTTRKPKYGPDAL